MGKGLKKKYYAVRIGFVPGIYYSWPECKAQVHKFKGAIFKGFENYSEAEEFMNVDKEKNICKNESYAYIDGSFNKKTKVYGYGGFIMHNNQKYIVKGSGNKDYLVKMRNVAGEILACQEVTKKAIQLGIKNIDIYYDYSGIEEWATGRWKRNEEGTKEYYQFMNSIKSEININFIKVKGHSGNEGNDEADRIAKDAAGIIDSDDENEMTYDKKEEKESNKNDDDKHEIQYIKKENKKQLLSLSEFKKIKKIYIRKKIKFPFKKYSKSS